MTPSPLTRRTFLKATLAGGAIAGAPRPLRAQPKPFRLAAVPPVPGPVAQQKRVPFLIDIAAADPITANVARSVKEGQQKVQYVYRNFPTGSTFGRKAVQYFTEIFAEAKVTPKRVALMHCNDLFGVNQSRGFLAAYKAAKPPWTLLEDDVIPWPEPPSDLSTEVARLKALKPDVISPITRPASALLLLPEIRKQRIESLGIVGPGTPGLYEAGQIAALKEDLEHEMASNPGADP